MKIKRQSIYLAGRYRSKWGALGKLWHIYKAGIKGIELAHQGYVVFNPIVNWGIFGLFDNDHEFWIAAGLKLLKDHEIIYMMRNSSHSQGAIMEWREAKRRGMEIQYEFIGDEVFLELMQQVAEAEDNCILYGDGSKPNLGRPINAIEPCTEPVTVPYKLEPEVKS